MAVCASDLYFSLHFWTKSHHTFAFSPSLSFLVCARQCKAPSLHQRDILTNPSLPPLARSPSWAENCILKLKVYYSNWLISSHFCIQIQHSHAQCRRPFGLIFADNFSIPMPKSIFADKFSIPVRPILVESGL